MKSHSSRLLPLFRVYAIHRITIVEIAMVGWLVCIFTNAFNKNCYYSFLWVVYRSEAVLIYLFMCFLFIRCVVGIGDTFSLHFTLWVHISTCSLSITSRWISRHFFAFFISHHYAVYTQTKKQTQRKPRYFRYSTKIKKKHKIVVFVHFTENSIRRKQLVSIVFHFHLQHLIRKYHSLSFSE